MSDSLPTPLSTRVFLSYARGDDETFVKRLHADLTAAGFTVWFDRESLMARGLTFHMEIKDAIRTEVDRVVYVGGPKAALSAYVREEWQFALECDRDIVSKYPMDAEMAGFAIVQKACQPKTRRRPSP